MSDAVQVDEETVLSVVGADTVIDRYVEAFLADLDVSDVDVASFDQFVLARGGDQQELIWGAAKDGSKHVVLLPDGSPDDHIDEVRSHVQQLNVHPTPETIDAFTTYLREQYDSLERLEYNRLIEMGAPVATKIGDYPVVNVVLYAYPGEGLIDVVEVTLKSSGFSIERREEVMEQVGRKTPTGDVRQYARSVHEQTLDDLRGELNANVVSGLTEETLQTAGYHRQKTATIPDDAHPIYEGREASQWQKDLPAIDGLDASTGFARVWLVGDDQIGVVQPTQNDVTSEDAIERIADELTDTT